MPENTNTNPPTSKPTDKNTVVPPAQQNPNPTPPPAQKPPQNQAPSTPPPSNNQTMGKLLKFFFWGGLSLIFIFYIVIFFGALNGNLSNPLFAALGVNEQGVKSFLLLMTNGIFGLISLLFFIMALIFIFRGTIEPRENPKRKKLFTRSVVFGTLFISALLLWAFFYWLILGIGTAAISGNDRTLIRTEPTNVIAINAPQKITFDLSQTLFEQIEPGLINQINWDFDGDTLTDATGPRVTYRFLDKGENDGRYMVTAEVFYRSPQDGAELSFKTEREVIIANESVTAVLSATPEEGELPLKVVFDATESRDPDGAIVNYEWDLDGDGIFEKRGDEVQVEKTFETVGTHTVKLRVIGVNNDYDVAEKVIMVNNPEGGLRAEITTDEPLEGVVPHTVVFSGENSFIREGSIVEYSWNIQDEDRSTLGRKMKHVFRTPGEYPVTLTIESDIGQRNQTEVIVKALPQPEEALLDIRTTPSADRNNGQVRGVAPFTVTFDASASRVTNALEWQWDFENDGLDDEFAQATQYTFREPGVYDVKLTILDTNDRAFEKIQTVIVERPGVRAKISTQPNAGEVPLTIMFDGSGSSTDEGEIIDYIWEFPDAEPIHYGAKISRLFKSIGNFTIKLTVLTSTGKIASTETIISARAPVIRADFSISPQRGTAPLLVTVNPVLSTGLVQEYFWDFGDGSRQNQMTPQSLTHTYSTPGEYTIKLRLTDEKGIVSEKEKIVIVEAPNNNQ
jgi:PKD repeat protein